MLGTYSLHNSRTLLTVDLSRTRAPPHLIEALRAMTVCGLRSVQGLKKIRAYAWPCKSPYLYALNVRNMQCKRLVLGNLILGTTIGKVLCFDTHFLMMKYEL